MKYMILSYGSQQDYDAMSGKATHEGAPSADLPQQRYLHARASHLSP